MLGTLLCSLILVGGLSLYITGKRTLNNVVETCERQLEAAAALMGEFWDASQYRQMTETGKRAYREFQFQMCFGEGYALIDQTKGEAEENFTGYQVMDMKAMELEEEGNSGSYRLQRLDGEMILLQYISLEQSEGFGVLSVRNISDVFTELWQTALSFLGISSGIFFLAGFFIYRMMKKTVRRMEELQEVAGKQELLLGALAHEMKTPLTSIIGYSDSLRHVKLDAEQKDRALEHINREGKRLETLSGKLLELLGLHQNRSVHMEEYSMEELVRRVKSMEDGQAEKLGIHFQTVCEEFSMKMDPELMESLLINLIDNAFHASERGGTVVLRVFREKDRKIIEIKDNGRGIPEKDVEKVTEAFYMVDKSRSRQNGGAGLGLALCVRIAELHRGKLRVCSQEGKGPALQPPLRCWRAPDVNIW